MKILLICGGGISTSIMVCMMEKESSSNDVIEAKSYDSFLAGNKDYDVILVAPQISFNFDNIQKICELHAIPTGIIPSNIYGSMNGKEVLKLAYQLSNKE